jgi:beta-glucanase (GH16 family)
MRSDNTRARTTLLTAAATIVAAAVLLSTAATAAGAAGPPPPTLDGRAGHLTLPGGRWKLAFADEFDGDKLDTSKWAVGLPWRGDDGTNRHHNSQYASVITDEDVQVKGGVLRLTSRRQDVPNPKGGVYRYTEGLITTSATFRSRYGYFEMRAKLPTEAGPGTWPAFWLLADGWPPEMDILEYWGSDNRIHQGTVTRAPDGRQRWDSYHRRQVSLSGWHTYGLEWGPGYQRYSIDGRVTHAVYGPHLPDAACYLLLNSGVETARPPRAGSTFPNAFEVDWVRVYARPEGVPALTDAGFEDSDDLRPWGRWNEAAVVDYGARTGSRCLRVDAGGVAAGKEGASSAEQTVYGLRPDTRYTVRAYAKVTGGATARLGVKGHGGDETLSPQAVSDGPAGYRPVTLTFRTGPQATSATVYCRADGEGTAFFDDVELAEAGQTARLTAGRSGGAAPPGRRPRPASR